MNNIFDFSSFNFSFVAAAVNALVSATAETEPVPAPKPEQAETPKSEQAERPRHKRAVVQPKATEPLTLERHDYLVNDAIEKNRKSPRFGKVDAVFCALRWGARLILEAEKAGQPPAEIEPIRSAHTRRVQSFMQKHHRCDEVEARKLAKEWLSWTYAQLKLPRAEQERERYAPGVSVPNVTKKEEPKATQKDAPQRPDKLTFEKAGELIRQRGNVESARSQAQRLCRIVAGDERFTPEERENLRVDIRAILASNLVSRGMVLEEAERDADNACRFPEQKRSVPPVSGSRPLPEAAPLKSLTEPEMKVSTARILTKEEAMAAERKAKEERIARQRAAEAKRNDPNYGAMRVVEKKDDEGKKKPKNKKKGKKADQQAA